MTFEVEVGGRIRRVSIERASAAGTYRIAVDGRARLVDVRRSSDFSLSLLVERGTVPLSDGGRGTVPLFSSQKLPPSAANGAETDRLALESVPNGGDSAEIRGTVPLSREVVVAPGTARGELLVGVDGKTVAATINGRRGGRAATGRDVHAHGEQRVVAPMPGRVVRVLVSPGDEVAARQGVIVVEAMKMENELRSPKAGRVKEVQVAAGASVDAGRVLVVVE